MRKQRGTSSRCTEKVLGYQVQGLGLFHLIHRERFIGSHETHKTRGESDRSVVWDLALEGAMWVSARWPREKRIQPHTRCPTQCFGGSANKCTGITRCAASAAASLPLFSHANQSPSKDCCRDLPHYVKRQTEYMKTWEGKKNHIRQEEQKFPCC